MPESEKVTISSPRNPDESQINSLNIDIPDLEQPVPKATPAAVVTEVSPRVHQSSKVEDKSLETIGHVVTSENYDLIDDSPILQQVMSGNTQSKQSNKTTDAP